MRDESLIAGLVKTLVLCFIIYLMATTWYIYMAHDTIFGLIQSSRDWAALVSEKMTNPPPWLSQGLPLYTSNFFANLDSQAIGTGNAALAGRVMKNLTSYVAGLSVAGVDFVSYNGVSAL